MSAPSYRPRILDAARRIDPERLTFAEVAKRAGCVESTVRSYFTTLHCLTEALSAPAPAKSPTRGEIVLALFDDGSVLTARDVADLMDWKIQLSSAHLHRLWARGQLDRRGQYGSRNGEVGYLYERRAR